MATRPGFVYSAEPAVAISLPANTVEKLNPNLLLLLVREGVSRHGQSSWPAPVGVERARKKPSARFSAAVIGRVNRFPGSRIFADQHHVGVPARNRAPLALPREGWGTSTLIFALGDDGFSYCLW